MEVEEGREGAREREREREREQLNHIDFVGAIIEKYFELLWSFRVAMVISGDMAHTHQSTGPYGYSNASQPFDDVR